jgi:hypothetical protein
MTENSGQIKVRFPVSIVVVAVIMILFGLAEIVTGLSHSFFGLITTPSDASTLLGVLLGFFYFAGGIFLLTKRKWAAGAAIALLCVDVIGRVAMVLVGLYPLTSFRQTFAIVVGTAIAAFFAIYVGLRWSAFR